MKSTLPLSSLEGLIACLPFQCAFLQGVIGCVPHQAGGFRNILFRQESVRAWPAPDVATNAWGHVVQHRPAWIKNNRRAMSVHEREDYESCQLSHGRIFITMEMK